MISSWRSVSSVAYKEFIHVWRDRRVLLLILILPPLFTILFGHAFEATTLKNIPAVLHDADKSSQSQLLTSALKHENVFSWSQDVKPYPKIWHDLKISAILTIPEGWQKSLSSGQPAPLDFHVDGSDTTTAPYLQGMLEKTLGEFQLQSRREVIGNLPTEATDILAKLPKDTIDQLFSQMEPWPIKTTIHFNSDLRFIQYVISGVIGLILQLLTVTLMACTITREREAGTLYQLMVTPMKRSDLVIGKMIPYLTISAACIAIIMTVAHFHFNIAYHQLPLISLICFLFLLCSLGLGVLISAFARTQTQAIQFAVFYLLPVFILSGAFAPLEQLPENIRSIAFFFPLTHFCHSFRLADMHHASIYELSNDLLFLSLGAIITWTGAVLLLNREHE